MSSSIRGHLLGSANKSAVKDTAGAATRGVGEPKCDSILGEPRLLDGRFVLAGMMAIPRRDASPPPVCGPHLPTPETVVNGTNNVGGDALRVMNKPLCVGGLGWTLATVAR